MHHQFRLTIHLLRWVMLGSLSGVLAGVSSWVFRGIYATPRIDVADGPDEIGGLPTITEWRKQNRHRHQLRT